MDIITMQPVFSSRVGEEKMIFENLAFYGMTNLQSQKLRIQLRFDIFNTIFNYTLKDQRNAHPQLEKVSNRSGDSVETNNSKWRRTREALCRDPSGHVSNNIW